ncbi:MAG: aminotransferase class IV, partial [Candidatus Altiarchaeota archaeon]|nr:aminotransferase class IV [Candidatus Altiarchaeota archaeon]
SEMEESIQKTLKANDRSDAYVRLTVTYGIGKPRLNLGGKSRPNYFIITDDVPDFTSQYEKGVRICVAECVKQSGRSFTPRMKTLNYVDRALAKKEALERGFYDALILDETGFVAEATTSNVFMVEGGKLVTSSSESVLRGITRKTVLELAGDAGLEVEEEDLSLERLMESSEVFMTNSISEIMPVIQVNDSTIGGGRPGKATRIIHEKYEKKVGEYVKGRIYRR